MGYPAPSEGDDDVEDDEVDPVEDVPRVGEVLTPALPDLEQLLDGVPHEHDAENNLKVRFWVVWVVVVSSFRVVLGH